MNDNIEIGKKLKDKRKEKGLTMREVGLLVGISESNTQRYESGKIKNVSIITLKAFAAALNVEVEYLIGYSEPVVAYKEDTKLHGFTVSLINRLLQEHIITDKDDIDQNIIDMIKAALLIDAKNKKR